MHKTKFVDFTTIHKRCVQNGLLMFSWIDIKFIALLSVCTMPLVVKYNSVTSLCMVVRIQNEWVVSFGMNSWNGVAVGAWLVNVEL